MQDDFEGAAAPFEPTIEKLAMEYGLPMLAELYNGKQKNVTLFEYDSLNLKQLNLFGLNCRIAFSYRDDIAHSQTDGLIEGFRIDLIDVDSGDVLLAALHAETPGRPGIFGIMGAGIEDDLQGLPIWQERSPIEVICQLTNSLPQVVSPVVPKRILN